MSFLCSNFEPPLRDKDMWQVRTAMSSLLLIKPLESVPPSHALRHWASRECCPHQRMAFPTQPGAWRPGGSCCWVARGQQLCFLRADGFQREKEKGMSQICPVPCPKLTDQIKSFLPKRGLRKPGLSTSWTTQHTVNTERERSWVKMSLKIVLGKNEGGLIIKAAGREMLQGLW